MKKVIIARALGSKENNRLKKIFTSYKIHPISTPVLRIIAEDKKNINLKKTQAVLLTSFHGVSFFSQRVQNLKIPVFAIGKSTSLAAKERGFKNIIECKGDTASMLSEIKNSLKPNDGNILYAGAEKTSQNIPKILENIGYSTRRIILYKALEVENLEKNIVSIINSGLVKLVVLLSNRGAQVFIKLSKKTFSKEVLSNLTMVCLSSSISSLVKKAGYKSIHPQKPEIEELPNLIINYKG